VTGKRIAVGVADADRRAVGVGRPPCGYPIVMGIGVGIFLIAVGAILTFAVHATVAGLDLHVVGWVLMLAGVAGLALFFVLWNRRRGPRTVVSEQRVYDDTPPPPL
jgi:uncharacterized protein DUF6458